MCPRVVERLRVPEVSFVEDLIFFQEFFIARYEHMLS